MKLRIDSHGKLNEEVSFQGILSKFLTSPQGRVQFAQAMSAPLRRRLDYSGIARKVLQVDPLPQGALSVYTRDVSDDEAVAFSHDFLTINSRGKLAEPTSFPFTRRVVIPTFEVFESPTIKISDIKQRRFNLIDRQVQKARNQIMEQEDETIFKQLDALGSDIDSSESGNNKE